MSLYQRRHARLDSGDSDGVRLVHVIALHGHEPRKLSHYPEDYTDPERIVLLCDYHNGGWVEDYPIERKLLGL